MQRPTGITILAVLAFIGGVFGILGGVALFSLGAIATGLGADAATVAASSTTGAILGVITLLVAILDLVFAIGAWGLKPWAWVLGIASQVISLLLIVFNIIQGSSISGQIVSIAISVILIFYLFTPTVKKAFGRA